MYMYTLYIYNTCVRTRTRVLNNTNAGKHTCTTMGATAATATVPRVARTPSAESHRGWEEDLQGVHEYVRGVL